MRGGVVARACAPHLEGQVGALSFQSVAELRYGAIKDGWSDTKKGLLEDRVRRFAVLGVDDATVQSWAELRARAEAEGKAKGIADLWIAATARRYDLPLLTTDRDFLSALDIRVLRPDDPPVARSGGSKLDGDGAG